MLKRFNFCAYADECPLKYAAQILWKNPVFALAFKELVIKFDLDGDI